MQSRHSKSKWLLLLRHSVPPFLGTFNFELSSAKNTTQLLWYVHASGRGLLRL